MPAAREKREVGVLRHLLLSAKITSHIGASSTSATVSENAAGDLKTTQPYKQIMKRIKLAIHGPEFSRMVYGTWRLLETRPTAQEINRRLHACLDLGITTIDTAEIYGHYEVEQQLGAALALSPRLRDQLELVTKADNPLCPQPIQ